MGDSPDLPFKGQVVERVVDGVKVCSFISIKIIQEVKSLAFFASNSHFISWRGYSSKSLVGGGGVGTLKLPRSLHLALSIRLNG